MFASRSEARMVPAAKGRCATRSKLGAAAVPSRRANAAPFGLISTPSDLRDNSIVGSLPSLDERDAIDLLQGSISCNQLFHRRIPQKDNPRLAGGSFKLSGRYLGYDQITERVVQLEQFHNGGTAAVTGAVAGIAPMGLVEGCPANEIRIDTRFAQFIIAVHDRPPA